MSSKLSNAQKNALIRISVVEAQVENEDERGWRYWAIVQRSEPRKQTIVALYKKGLIEEVTGRDLVAESKVRPKGFVMSHMWQRDDQRLTDLIIDRWSMIDPIRLRLSEAGLEAAKPLMEARAKTELARIASNDEQEAWHAEKTETYRSWFRIAGLNVRVMRSLTVLRNHHEPGHVGGIRLTFQHNLRVLSLHRSRSNNDWRPNNRYRVQIENRDRHVSTDTFSEAVDVRAYTALLEEAQKFADWLNEHFGKEEDQRVDLDTQVTEEFLTELVVLYEGREQLAWARENAVRRLRSLYNASDETAEAWLLHVFEPPREFTWKEGS